MKRIKYAILTTILLTLSMSGFAQLPPPPNGGNSPNGGNTPVGGGVPIGNGITILILLGFAYSGNKLFLGNNRKNNNQQAVSISTNL